MQPFFRKLLIVTALIAGCAEEPTVTPHIVPTPPPPPPAAQKCVTPWGIDWSTMFELQYPLANEGCPAIPAAAAGYAQVQVKATNTESGLDGFPIVYPTAYDKIKHHADPMTDYLNKLDSIRYVIHPSGEQYQFDAAPATYVMTIGDLYRGSDLFKAAEYGKPAAATVNVLPPLPPGTHTVEVWTNLTAMHCDGLSTDAAKSCHPKGDALVGTFTVTVK
jgi:hypothetical protein